MTLMRRDGMTADEAAREAQTAWVEGVLREAIAPSRVNARNDVGEGLAPEAT
jgi:hypothetical protein